MRYVMKQKLLSWGDDFVIRDEAGRDVFYVDGKAFSLGNQLSFQDMQGNELASIRQKLLAWGPTYEIYGRGELKAVVKKALFTLLHCRFSVDVPGPDDLEARGTSPSTSTRSSGPAGRWRRSRSGGSPGRTPMAWTSPRGRMTS